MLDEALKEAIISVVSDAGQPKAVASRLLAWLEELSKQELGKDEQSRFFEMVRDELVLKETGHGD